jgi:putative exosortase-associated protein (TIGR04073 family)
MGLANKEASIMRRITSCAIIAVGLLTLGVLPGWANNTLPPSGWEKVDEFMGRQNFYPAFDKLGRGVSNTLGGWLEIPLNIQQRYRRDDMLASAVAGAMVGLVKGLVRTGVGVYEAATFFLPLPENFAPILPTLPYFDRSTKREPLLLE